MRLIKSGSLQLWQEITLTLVFKICLLAVIWMVWFSVPQDTRIDPQQVSAHFFSPQSQKEPEHDADAGAR